MANLSLEYAREKDKVSSREEIERSKVGKLNGHESGQSWDKVDGLLMESEGETKNKTKIIY